VRHCTPSPEGLAHIGCRHGDHSRLGHALMLRYLRHPGRPLQVREHPPVALVAFVADQLAGWLLPHAIEDDRLAHLAGSVLEKCRRRRIVVPLPSTFERFCMEVRHRTRREVHGSRWGRADRPYPRNARVSAPRRA